jgi:hypothetical protein
MTRFWRAIRFTYFARFQLAPRVAGDDTSAVHLAEWNVLGLLGVWIGIVLFAAAAVWIPFAGPAPTVKTAPRIPMGPAFLGLVVVAIIGELLWKRRRRAFIERLQVEFAGTDPSTPENKRLLRKIWVVPLAIMIALAAFDVALARAFGR